jgi:AraC-like DNA-binding protein
VHRGGGRIEIHYSSADGRRPLEPTNFDMWHALLQENYLQITAAPAAPEADSVGQRVRDILLVRVRSQAQVAQELGTSVATMRRRLRAEGIAFRQIKADVRRALLADGLTSDRRLEDLAEDVGFSEARSLRRVATRWFGASPSVLRQELGQRGSDLTSEN